jgi:Acetyltransferase (GNAT) family
MKVHITYLKYYQEYTTALARWSFNLQSQYSSKCTIKSQIKKYKSSCHDERLPLTLIALNENQKLVGMCSVKKHNNYTPQLTPWLHSLYVPPPYEGYNIENQLTDAIKQIAKEMNFNSLYSVIAPDLRPCYEKQGWSLFSKEKWHHQRIFIMQTGVDTNIDE